MELNDERRGLWEVVSKYENQPFVQIAAHKEIHAITKSIKQLYETLQVIINNKDNTSNAFSDLIDEDMTSIFPECSP